MPTYQINERPSQKKKKKKKKNPMRGSIYIPSYRIQNSDY